MKIFIFLLLLGHGWASFLPNGCPADFSVHLLLPHETDCTKFYQCSNGLKLTMECPRGTAFDVELQICNWADEVGCNRPDSSTTTTGEPTTTTREPTTTTRAPTTTTGAPTTTIGVPTITTPAPPGLPNECPSDFDVVLKLPHEIDCDKYYNCSDGIKILLNCPTGKYFDMKLQDCDWSQNVDCASGGSEKRAGLLPNGCPADFDIHKLLPHETNCSKFYYCNFGNKIERECSGDTHFNPKLQVCDWPASAGCFSEGGEWLPNGCPSDFSVHWLLPHETDCNQFYYCNFGEKLVRRCPSGLHFDPKLQVCNWPNAVNCTSVETTIRPDTTVPSVGTTKEYITTTTMETTEPTIETTTGYIPTTTRETTESLEETTTEYIPTTTRETTEPSVETTTENIPTTTRETTEPSVETTTEYIPTTTREITEPTVETTTEYIPTTTRETTEPSLETTTEYIPTTTRETTDPTVETTTEFIPTTTRETTEPSLETTTEYIPTTTRETTEPTVETTTEFISTTTRETTEPSLETTTEYIPTTTRETTLPTLETTTEYIPTTTRETTEPTVETTTEYIPTTTRETTEPTVETTTEYIPTTVPTTTQETTTTPVETTTVTTTESIETTTPINIVCPPGMLGFVPHPDYCDAYYVCVNGDPTLIWCNEGYEFDPDRNICVEISEDGCFASQGKWTPTVPDQTTTETPLTTDHYGSTTESTETTSRETELPRETTTENIPTTVRETTKPTVETTTEYIPTTTKETTEPTVETTTEYIPATTKETTEPTVETTTEYIPTTTKETTEPTVETTTEYIPTTTRETTEPTVETTTDYIPTTERETTEPTVETTTEYIPTTTKETTEPTLETTTEYIPTTTRETTEPTVETTTEYIPTTVPTTTQETTTTPVETTTVTTTESIEITTPINIVCPPGMLGFVPHPDYCDAYYICIRGIPSLMWCSEGHEFDPDRNICVEISEDGCFASQGKWTPTVPDQTTTETPLTTDHYGSTTESTETSSRETELPRETTTENIPTTVRETTKPTVETTTEYIPTTSKETTEPTVETTTEYIPATTKETTEPTVETTTEYIPTTTRETTEPTVETTTEYIPTTNRETTEPTIETTTEYIPTTTRETTEPTVETTTEYIPTTTRETTEPTVETTTEYIPTTPSEKTTTVQEITTEQQTTDPSVETTTAHDTTEPPVGTTTNQITTERDADTTIVGSTTENWATTTESIETTTPINIVCPPGMLGFVPHPDYCDAYYVCVNGDPTLIWCNEGYEFDPDRNVCAEISEDGCFASQGKWTPTVPDQTTTETPLTTDHYGSTTELPGETTTAHDTTEPPVETTTKQITTERDADTTTVGSTTENWATTTESIETTTPINIVCPPGMLGFVPHPDYCDAYYVCVNGDPTLIWCNEGYEFDPDRNVCVEISEDGCFASQGKWTPTVPDQTTTETPLTTDHYGSTTELPGETTTAHDTTEPPVETTTKQITTERDADTTTVGSTTENWATTTESIETTTPINIECPPGMLGFVPHPDYCDAYYVCVNGDPTLIWCNEGYEFDPDRNVGGRALGPPDGKWSPTPIDNVIVCAEISEDGCFASQGKWTPTVPDQTTTETPLTTDHYGSTTELPGETTTAHDTTEPPVETTTKQITTERDADTTTVGSTTENWATTTESIETTTPINIECPPGMLGFVPHPDYCDAYYVCVNGDPTLIWCNEGYEFDPDRNVCVEVSEDGCFASQGKWTPTVPDQTTTETPLTTDHYGSTTELPGETTTAHDTTEPPVETTTKQITTERDADTTTVGSTTENWATTTESIETTTPINIECPPGMLGFVPHPDYCDAYYVCVNGDPTLIWCNEGYEFDPDRNVCVEISEDGCFASQGKWTPTVPDQTTTETPLTTDHYGSTTELPGETTTAHDTTEPPVETTTKQITTERDADTTTVGSTTENWATTTESIETTTPINIECPPGMLGFVPHPDYCDAYYVCVNGDPTLIWCNEGYEFDPDRNVCAEISEDGCFASQGKWTPTVPDQTTTETPLTTDHYGSTTELPGETTTAHDTTEPPVETTTKQITTERDADTTTVGSTTENWATTTESIETTTPINIECPPGMLGFVPHPDYCDAYYVCINGDPTLIWCNEGYEFDPDRNVCVEVSEDGCFASQGKWTPTVPDQTTTETPLTTDHYGSTTELPGETTTAHDTTEPPVETTTKQITTERDADTTTVGSTTENWATTTESIETTTPINIECPPGMLGFVPHPDYCDAYYVCVNGDPTLIWCNEGYEFDPDRNVCVEISEDGCFASQGKWTPTVPDQTTTETPLTTDHYGSTTELPGETTTAHDTTEPPVETTTKQITTERDADTTTVGSTTENWATTTESIETTTPINIVCPPGMLGFVPHPDYCDAYYVCVNGDPTLIWCNEGYEFDPDRNVCVEISEDGCFASQGKWTPTVPDQTTTETPLTTDHYGSTTELPGETTTAHDTTEPPVETTTKQITTERDADTTTVGSTTENWATTTESIETTTPINIECPPGMLGFVPHPDYCDAYYVCVNGDPTLIWCNEGYEFDPDRKVCVEISEDGCFASQGKWTPTVPDQTTTETPLTTDHYGSTTELPGETTIAHDTTEPPVETTTKQITTERDADTTTVGSTTENWATTTESIETTTPINIECPPGMLGFVPHPDYCDAYYVCVNGDPTLIWCNEGYEFDPDRNVCVEISEDGCFASQGKWTPTVPDQTTTETPLTTDHYGSTTELPRETTTAHDTTEQPIETTTKQITTERDADTTTVGSTTENWATTTESIETTTPINIVCPPGMLGFVPHPDYCDAYYVCVNGDPTLIWCNEGYEFDPDRNVCVEISEDGCFASQGKWTPTVPDQTTTETPLTTDHYGSTTELPGETTTAHDTTEPPVETTTKQITTERDADTTTVGSTTENWATTTESIETTTPINIECPPGMLGFVPHPDYCDAYYVCVNGDPTLIWCNEGYEFDPDRNVCVEISEDGCFASQGKWTPTVPDQTTTETPLTTDHYGSTTELPGETTTAHDTTEPPVETTTKQITTERDDDTTTVGSTTENWATTTESIETTTPINIECPPGMLGFVPHPDYCDAYYVCVNGDPTLIWCNEGYEFDPDRNVCVEISEDGCFASQGKWTPTVPDQTTTETPLTTDHYGSTTELPGETTIAHDTTEPPVETTTKQITTERDADTTTVGSTTENWATTTESIETTTPINIVCPPGMLGFVPHPDHCDAYYVCVNGDPTLIWCNEGYEFDPDRNVCVEISEDGCFASQGKWTPTVPDQTTTETPLTTDHYGSTTELPGETTTAHDTTEPPVETTTKQITTERDDDTTTVGSTTENWATTTESIETTTPINIECPPGMLGFVPHPDYCDAYYVCVNGDPTLIWCNEGYEFDPDRNVCVEISEDGCFASQGKWTPTVPDQTTTETPLTTDHYGSTTELPGETTIAHDTTEPPVETTTKQITTERDADTTTVGSTTENWATTTESIETTTPINIVCPPGMLGFVPHPDHCDAYYVCVNGDPTLIWCNEGYEFDPDRNVCVEISEDGCFASQGKWTPTVPDQTTTETPLTTDQYGSTTELPGETTIAHDTTEPPVETTTKQITTERDADTTTVGSTTENWATTTESIETTTPINIVCPPGMLGFVPHPDHCDAYYVCVNGDPTLIWCNEGYEFDPDRNVCVEISEDGCFASQGKWTPTVPDQTTTETPLTTDHYGSTTELPGETTTAHDTTEPPVETTTKQITTERDADTTTVGSTTENWATTTESIETTTPINIVCPPGMLGFVPHPDYCDAYYVCVNGDPTLIWCNEGYEFDPDRNVCVEISEDGCFASQGKWTPTVPDQTTTETPLTTDHYGSTTELPRETTTAHDTTEPPVETTTKQITTERDADTTTIGSTTENWATTTESIDTTTPINIVCPPGMIGFVPHPDHCDAYYVCVNGDPTLIWCNEGYEFDPDRNICVEISEDGCFASQGKWTPTVPDQTTTETTITTDHYGSTAEPTEKPTEGTTADSVDTTLGNTGSTDDSSETTIGGTGTTAGSVGTTLGNTGTTGDSSEITTGGTGTTAGSVGTTLGYTGTTDDSSETTSGGTGTTVGAVDTTLGNTGTTDDSSETTTGGTGTTAGSVDTTLGNTGTTDDSSETTTGGTGTTAGSVGTTLGYTGTTDDSSETTTGGTDTTTGSVDTTLGNTGTTDDSSETTPGGTGTTAGSVDTTLGNTGTTDDSSGTTTGGTSTTAGSVDTTLGYTGTTDDSSETTTGGTSTTASSVDTTLGDTGTTDDSSESTTGGTGTTAGSVDTTLGNTGTTDDSSETTTGGTGTTAGSVDTTLGNTGTTDDSSETTTGGTSTTAGSVDTTLGYTGTTDDSSETTTGGTSTTDESSETTTGVTGTTAGSVDTTLGNTGTTDDSSETTTGGTGTTAGSVDTTLGNTGTTDDSSETTTGGTGTTAGSVDTTLGNTGTTDDSIETTTGETGTTVVSEATTPPSICPPGVFGNVPHPELCDVYYMCIAGIPTLLPCTEGYEFDPAVGQCVVISENGCFASKGMWTPTEQNPTTTESSHTTTDISQTTTDDSFETTTGGTGTTAGSVGTTLENTGTTDDFSETTTGGTGTTAGSVDTTLGNTGTTDESIETTTGETGTTVVSEATTPPSICPPGVFGNVPHPELCDVYYMCIAGIPTLLPCTEGYEFDSAVGQCVVISENGCFASKGMWTPTESHSTTDSSYVTTDVSQAVTDDTTPDEKLSTTDLPEGDVTTAESLETTTQELGTTTLPAVTTPANLCPPGVFGNVPHPELCDVYYMCMAGVATLLPCSNGYEFDASLGQCVVISENGCFASKGMWTPTESNDHTDISVQSTINEDAERTTEEKDNNDSSTIDNSKPGDQETTSVLIPTTGEGQITTELIETTTINVCPPNFSGIVPDPERCDRFFHCTVGHPIALYCGAGFEFDINAQSCVPITEDGCYASKGLWTPTESQATEQGTQQPEVTTDSDISTTISDIIIGDNDKATTEYADVTAPEDDESHSETTTSPIEVTTASICPPGVFGNVPDPDRCDKFYMCTAGTAIPLYCGKGFEFDPKDQQCVIISENGCFASRGSTSEDRTEGFVVTTDRKANENIQTTPKAEITSEAIQTTPAICPPGVFGNVPDPENCNKFYMCTAGISIPLYCSAGFEFDPVVRDCVIISDHGCTASKS